MAGQRAMEGEITAEAAASEPTLGDDAPLKLEHFLPYQLNVVSSLVSQALSRVYARRYGIGVPEWRVLVTLGQYERHDRPRRSARTPTCTRPKCRARSRFWKSAGCWRAAPTATTCARRFCR